MKKALIILILGLAGALFGYAGVYYFATAHHCDMVHGPEPELAWLKEEFHVSDAEFAKVSQLHEEYLNACMERCKIINAKNEQLSQLLTGTNRVTPEIEALLSEAAQLRAQCQKAMLEHCYQISRSLPPAQGKRYLDWVQHSTVVSDTHATMHH